MSKKIIHKDLNNYVQRYERSTAIQLSDVYGKCSTAKHRAFKFCQDLMYELKGYYGRIVSYNTNMFTYAFQNDYNFYVITKDNIYRMPLSEVR